jgi:hypothetical protein
MTARAVRELLAAKPDPGATPEELAAWKAHKRAVFNQIADEEADRDPELAAQARAAAAALDAAVDRHR